MTAVRLSTQRRAGRGMGALRALLAILFVLVVLLILLAIVGAIRYLPALDTAREARATLMRAMSRLDDGADIEPAALDAAAGDLADARRGVASLALLLNDDAVIDLARGAPLVGQHVRGADEIIAAAMDVVDGGDALLLAARTFVTARDAQGDPMPRLVRAMRNAAPDVARGEAALRSASQRVDGIPDGLFGQITEARDELRDRLGRILPGISAYAAADDYLPLLLGADGERRYLVLAQDPAELRPTGGFMGTFGIVTVRDGAIAESDFQDVYRLDLKPGLPYVEPPPDLRRRLLGEFSWQLADSNWSPDYPTSAQKALELYTLESGDSRIDGVIVLTTMAIDKLLTLTGPVEVTGYDVTVRAGDTLFVALANTRNSLVPGEGRKRFLDVLADELFAELRALPSDQWEKALKVLEEIRSERQAMVWLTDPSLQAHVTEGGWDGQLRDDAGDFLMPVDSNVAPVGKLNSVVARSMTMSVQLDAVGNAHNSLDVWWQNPILVGEGRDFEILRTVQAGRQILGNFARIVVPERSRFEAVSGGSLTPVTSLESSGTEAGRDWFGAYLMIPPGDTAVRWQWTAPYVADLSADEVVYRLTVQKQPGTVAEAFALTVAVPNGAQIVSASDGASIAGATVHWSGDLQVDLEFEVRYTIR